MSFLKGIPMKNRKLLFILFIFLFTSELFSRTIIDMDNNKIKIPIKIERVFGSAPPTTFLVSLYNPDLLVGLNFPAFNMNNFGDKYYLGDKFMNLNILGGWQGSQKGANIEMLLKKKTQVILAWNNDLLLKKINKSLNNINIPTIMINGDDLEKMPQTFEFLGELFNMPKRGEELATYAKNSLDYISNMTKNIPKNKEITFYYAEGKDGLSSDCTYSFHTTQFRYIHAKNIYECEQKDIMGMESINFETILKADPDVIIVQSPKFYTDIFKSLKWKMLKAVKNKKVYLVPRIPYNWIDRPPSFMRLLGIHWLSSIIYPQYYKKDINEEIKRFYKIFFKVDLEEERLKEITKRAF